MMMLQKGICWFMAVSWAGSLTAEVTLPGVLGDHMVLQRGKPVAVWGTADPGEEVTVSFAEQTKKTTAGQSRRWSVKLDAMKESSSPATLTVKGKNEIHLKDVLVGEVWLCSGQSNMGFTVLRAFQGREEAAAADFQQIRLLTIPRKMSETPLSDLTTAQGWLPANTPEAVGNFSAVGYFFGREIHTRLKVPIGLINSSWGGTRVEAWTSQGALDGSSSGQVIDKAWADYLKTYDLAKEKADWEAKVKSQEERIARIKTANAQPGAQLRPVPAALSRSRFQDVQQSPHRPAVLFNAMISPLVPYTLRGALWYQGEANHPRAVQYQELLPTMIRDWRRHWGDSFSFYQVQLAGYSAGKAYPQPVGSDDSWAELQWAQFLIAQQVPQAGMAVANDLGEEKDVHPRNKQEVGRRLALQALAKDYQIPDLVPGGPIYGAHDLIAGRYHINFKNGQGLKTRDGGPLQGFIIAGADKVWKTAQATIMPGRPTVQVWSDEVPEPVAVRYAWAGWCPEANLVNEEGLPASLFRTDQWELSTARVEDPFALPPRRAPQPKRASENPRVVPSLEEKKAP